jgi:hypothetical protein
MAWPSDSEIVDMCYSEHNFPNLFSDYFDYHVEKLDNCGRLLSAIRISEFEVMNCDSRYFGLFKLSRKTRIYKICSSKFHRIYIGYTSYPLVKRYVEHITSFLSEPDSISSYKVLIYGNSWIELIEECELMDKNSMKELEGKHMRDNIEILVNWKKECRTLDELKKDYMSGVELRYYADVSLNEKQDIKKRNQLSRYLKKGKVGFGAMRDDKRICEVVSILREDISDREELKRISKYIKDKTKAQEELIKRKEMYKFLEDENFFDSLVKIDLENN